MTYILIAAVIIAIIAAAAGAYMQYQAGEQQKKAHKYNQRLAEQNAEQARMQGLSRAEDIRRRNRVALAAMEAQTGASGVEMAPGTSPMAAYAWTAREAELDALRAEWSGDANAQSFTADARLQRFYGQNAAYTGKMQAGTTLLSGASSAARTYYGA